MDRIFFSGKDSISFVTIFINRAAFLFKLLDGKDLDLSLRSLIRDRVLSVSSIVSVSTSEL